MASSRSTSPIKNPNLTLSNWHESEEGKIIDQIDLSSSTVHKD